MDESEKYRFTTDEKIVAKSATYKIEETAKKEPPRGDVATLNQKRAYRHIVALPGNVSKETANPSTPESNHHYGKNNANPQKALLRTDYNTNGKCIGAAALKTNKLK
ncbi:hypothetical protein Trydic_g16932 [Trypoxylus dichotomus]